MPRIELNGFNMTVALDEVAGCMASQVDEPDDLEQALIEQTPTMAASAVLATQIDDDQGPHQSSRNRKRAHKRKQAVESRGHSASPRTIFEHVQLSEHIDLPYDASSMPATKGAFSGMRLGGTKAENEREYKLGDLEAMGFRVVEWDGV
ncbi:hypothetical protein BJ165DRAFT_1403671 [Panaeolus papilionaceus]|nr:hypothetical protein BJ165DRAFT_1403671 [Panaeolus papilionaceus]